MITKPFIIHEVVITIELSIGLQLVTKNISLHTLLKGADNALIDASKKLDDKIVIKSEEK